MRDTFPCLQQAGTGLFKAKGSKFHGYAFPLPFHDEAAAERAVDEHLEAVRKEHHAARHVCYAWQFGPTRFRAADDGEPGGSAGAPIHGVLRAHDLHWTLIAVVRYFGGVKLGVGGLIEAYREAGADVLFLIDTWGGLLPFALYDIYVLNSLQTITNHLKSCKIDIPLLFYRLVYL